MAHHTDRNFVLTQPLHFEGSNFDGKAGDVCIWRAPGQLVVYRSGSLVANFKLSLLSLLSLKSEAIFSTGQAPKGIDTSEVPSLSAPEVVYKSEVEDEDIVPGASTVQDEPVAPIAPPAPEAPVEEPTSEPAVEETAPEVDAPVEESALDVAPEETTAEEPAASADEASEGDDTPETAEEKRPKTRARKAK